MRPPSIALRRTRALTRTRPADFKATRPALAAAQGAGDIHYTHAGMRRGTTEAAAAQGHGRLLRLSAQRDGEHIFQ